MLEHIRIASSRPLLQLLQGRSLMNRTESVVSGSESDEYYVNRVLRTGDSALYSIVVMRYRQKLSALVATALAGSSASGDVEDIVQDSFLAAFDNLKTFKQDYSFRPWLYKIALNRCKDRLRQCRRLNSSADLDVVEAPGRDPLDEVLEKDQIRRVNEAVNQLPVPLRVIFLLRHMEELSYCELASITGLPEGTVKTHLFRARAKVKEILKETEHCEL